MTTRFKELALSASIALWSVLAPVHTLIYALLVLVGVDLAAAREMKNLAMETASTVVLVSQLNRALETRPDRRPLLNDLRDSGTLEDYADKVLLLYRDEVYNYDTPDKGIVEVNVAKHRRGPTGVVRLKFFPEYTRVENCAIRD